MGQVWHFVEEKLLHISAVSLFKVMLFHELLYVPQGLTCVRFCPADVLVLWQVTRSKQSLRALCRLGRMKRVFQAKRVFWASG